MSSDDPQNMHALPGLFVPHVETFVAQRGGDVRELYRAAGLIYGQFESEQEALSEDQFYRLIINAAKQTAEPAFGLAIGRQFSLASFGLLSRALMSCATLQDLSQMLERYSVLVLPLVRFSSYEQEDALVLEINSLSRYPDLNQLIIEALIAYWQNVFPLLVGKPVTALKIECSFAAPPYVSEFPAEVSQCYEFGAERNLITLNKTYADLALLTANPTDAREMMGRCESELIKSQQTRSLSERASDQVRYYLDTNPSSSSIAARLNLTERTFRRQLAREGTSYRALLQSAREDVAKYYLSETNLQVAQIALKLGYQETSNFRAAFKNWTGQSPRSWRDAQRDK